MRKLVAPPPCIFIIIAAVIIVASCRKEVKSDITKKAHPYGDHTADFFISQGVASSYYARLAYQKYVNDEYTSDDTTTVPAITSTIVVHDSLGNISMYIFNFGTNQGFLTMAADLRVEPVLSYGKTGSLGGTYSGTVTDLVEDSVVGGVYDWFSSVEKYIAQVRVHFADSNTVNGYFAMRWKEILPSGSYCANRSCSCYPGCLVNPGMYSGGTTSGITEGYPPPVGPLGPCPTGISITGPLLNTKWGQDRNYNIFMPSASECTGIPNGKYFTGCEITAAAQVLKYWGFPNNYTWSSMPNDPPGNSYIATLMTDLANDNVDFWNTSRMNYSCTGTGAYTYDMRDVLTSITFGYNTFDALYQNFNSGDVISNIDDGKPVIMDGYVKVGGDGHCWVCDGYKLVYDCNSETCYFHMNWGWDGIDNDYYIYGFFNPPGNPTFNANNKMIKNLHH